jgi:hypothetical protein
LSSRGDPAAPGKGLSLGSPALDGLSLLELLELLELLLESEPGMGGAEPGNGNWSSAFGFLVAGAGASGALDDEPEGVAAAGSPGNGNRSDVDGSFEVVDEQGLFADVPFPSSF